MLDRVSQASSVNLWQDILRAGIWRHPLPELGARIDRTLARLCALAAARQIEDIERFEQVLPDRDPFILIANHSSRREVAFLTAVLMLARGGRPVGFLADWNFRLIPGVGYLYDHSGAITVDRKPAKPRFLNRLKPYFTSGVPAHTTALRQLSAGQSIGLFPEGTVNRNPDRLLRLRPGAVRLALAAGVPIVPLGIQYARRRDRGRGIDSRGPIRLIFGEPISPPAGDAARNRAAIAAFKLDVTAAMARASGKASDDAATPRGHAQDTTDLYGEASC